jgi:hypothetical protein
MFLQNLDNPYMGPPLGSAASQGNADFHFFRPSRNGGSFFMVPFYIKSLAY